MPLPGRYAPVLPQFDRFLFASIGDEVNGIPLSVLSALARLGLDPRDEAARLSHLAVGVAADQLAATIARLPDRGWTSSEMRRIAGGLIELLNPGPPATKSGKGDELRPDANPIRSRSKPLFIGLGLAVAVLIGLVALGALSFGDQRSSQSYQADAAVRRG